MLTLALLVLIVLVIVFVAQKHAAIKEHIANEISLVHRMATKDFRLLNEWIGGAESRATDAVGAVSARVTALEPVTVVSAAVSDVTSVVTEAKAEVAKVERAL